jgi:alpha-beta hydrolase superfamily lysophospholipase
MVHDIPPEVPFLIVSALEHDPDSKNRDHALVYCFVAQFTGKPLTLFRIALQTPLVGANMRRAGKIANRNLESSMWKKIGLALTLLLPAACASPCMPVGRHIVAPMVKEDHFMTWDGTVLPLRHWDAAHPRAIIIALHGMSDYSNAFDGPAKFWAAEGITTYAYDQRGFGRSPHPGRWAGGGAMRADLTAFAAAMHEKFPHLPVYALGESMGGAVLLTALAGAHPPRIAGAILAAPAVWARRDMPLSYRALLFLAERLVPGLILSNNAGGRLVHVVASDNVAMLRALARDPLFQKTTRVSALYGLVDLMDAAYDAPARLAHPPPILLLYGKKDQLIPARATHAVIAALGARARMRCYPRGYHMLLRDLDAKLVWQDIAHWVLNHQLPMGAPAACQPPM